MQSFRLAVSCSEDASFDEGVGSVELLYCDDEAARVWYTLAALHKLSM